MAKVYYFAFGANMSGRVLARRNIRPLSAARAVLPDHELCFGERGIPWIEPVFATVTPSVGRVAHGVAYCLGEPDFRALCGFEGAGYRSLRVQVQSEGAGPLMARTFCSRAVCRGLLPSWRYLRLLVAGAKEHSLPPDYVAWLEAHPVAPGSRLAACALSPTLELWERAMTRSARVHRWAQRLYAGARAT